MRRTVESLEERITELRRYREDIKATYAQIGVKITKHEQQIAHIKRKEKSIDDEQTSE